MLLHGGPTTKRARELEPRTATSQKGEYIMGRMEAACRLGGISGVPLVGDKRRAAGGKRRAADVGCTGVLLGSQWGPTGFFRTTEGSQWGPTGFARVSLFLLRYFAEFDLSGVPLVGDERRAAGG